MINWQRLHSSDNEEYMIEVLSINLTHIENTLQNQPALYGAAELGFEAAETAVFHAKEALTKAETGVFNVIQKREKGLAVAKTDRLVAADPDVEEARYQLIEAQATRGRARALCKGLTQRKDMLIQISSRQKAERW